MPHANGLQLLKDLRTGQAGVPRGLPFALLTGFAERPLVRLAVQLDADAFLAKPVDAAALVRHVEQLLHHGPRQETELHEAEHYAAIDVDTPVGHIVLEQDESSPSSAEMGEAGDSQSEMGPLSSTARIQDPPAGPSVVRPSFENEVFEGREISLSDVPPGLRLAWDLHYIAGWRLLRAGERLSERTVNRLRSMSEIDEIPESIWIVSEDLSAD